MLRSVGMLERHAAVLDTRLDIRLVGRSAELARLADEDHATIVEALARSLRGAGFVVEPEVSFSEWGERGRIDLLAYEPARRTLLVIEVKTLLADLQDLLGSIDVRERLASTIARRRGWPVNRTGFVLAIAATGVNRGVVGGHPELFRSFSVLRFATTTLLGVDGRVLIWVHPRHGGRPHWIAGRERVRAPRRAE